MAIQHPEQLTAPTDNLPIVHGEVFSRIPQAAYYVGVVAVGEYVNEPAYLAARQLRFQCYNELGWLPTDKRDDDGGEHDEYDENAVHIGVIKNSQDGPRMIANARLIRRTPERPLLPVEHDFADAFLLRPAGANDVEISRLISASSDKQERHGASLAVQRAMIGWCAVNGVDYCHAMVEPYLMKVFDKTGVNYEIRSDLKEIPEYGNTINAAVTIDPIKVAGTLNTQGIGVPVTTSLFFQNVMETQGQGYYGANFVRRYE